MNSKLAELHATYETLRTWCDNYFAAAYKTLKRHMKCGRGCGTCCALNSASPLEAQYLREFLSEHPEIVESLLACPPGTRAGAPALDREMCPFLLHRECSVYPARPVICRTHGLAVRHRGTGIMASCAYNFMDRDVDQLEESQILDADRVTENLMRLNLAYCRLTDQESKAGTRVMFADILAEAVARQKA